MYQLASFDLWNVDSSVNENVQAAKAVLLKKYAEENRLNFAEISKEDQQKIIRESEDYQAIVSALEKAKLLGYAFAFAKFRFENNVDLYDLIPNPNATEGSDDMTSEHADLISMIKKYDNLLNLLPMSIEEYSKQKIVNGVNSFEALYDAFNNLEIRRKSKWIIDETPGELRRKLKAMDQEYQDRLISAAKMIDDVDSKVGNFIDPETGRETNHKISLLKKVKAFVNSTTGEYLDWVEKTADGVSNSDIASKINRLETLKPEAGVIYVGLGYLVLGIRTEKAQKDLCSIANWCINRGSWGTYGGQQNRVQINIFDFNKKSTEDYHIIGITAEGDKRVTHSHDKSDNSLLDYGQSVYIGDLLKKLKYPQELITKVEDSVSKELLIKQLVNGFGINASSPEEVLRTILKASYDSSKVKLEEDSAVIDPILEIINDRVKKTMSSSEIVEAFMQRGFISTFAAKLFNLLVPDLSEADKRRVIARATEAFEEFKEIILYFGTSAPESKRFAEALKRRDEIIKILQTGESIERTLD